MRRISQAFLLLAVLAACNKTPPAGDPDETRTPMTSNDAVTSLEVNLGRDSVGFALHLTNSGTQPLVLEFNSAQRYDFEVQTPAGQKVWRWSDDMGFAAALGTETLGAGESREYRASWAPGSRTGTFVAVARVVATNRPIEQQTQFEIKH
jgi:hypothetical protein